MTIVKYLTKAFTICLCCILTLGAVCYISPPIETHAVEVTDLTNTTWYVPSGWSSSSAFDKFSINGTVIQNGYETEYFSFLIGYSFDGDYNNTANSVLFEGYAFTEYHSTQDFTFKITGGTEVTNPKLIAWLVEYGQMLGTEPEIPEITTQTTTTLVGFNGFYQDIIFPSLDGLGITTSINPVGIARLNGETGIVIGTTAYSGLVLWTEYNEAYTTAVEWFSLDKGTQSIVYVTQGDLILSALGTDGTVALDIAIIKPYNKGTELPYIYINSVAYPAIRNSMQAYGDTIYYLSADGGAVGDYSYVEVDIENRTYTIPTVADVDANNKWAIFQRLNSQWIAEINSYNVGVSNEFGNNLIIDTLKAPFTILDSITLFIVNGTAITLAHLFGALIGLSLFFLFLKLFAGG